MAQFVLLLKGGKFEKYSPEDMQTILEDYLGWAQKLREQNRYRAGEELKNTGRVLEMRNNHVIDGPFTETKESIGGFFLIEAENYDDAIRVSRECPHLKYNGWIELREVNPH